MEPTPAPVQQSGLGLEVEGKYAKAIADYNEAIRLNPGFGECIAGLAEIFATCPGDGTATVPAPWRVP